MTGERNPLPKNEASSADIRRDWADRSSFNGNAGRLREDIDIVEGRRPAAILFARGEWLVDDIGVVVIDSREPEGSNLGNNEVCALAAASASAFAAAAAAAASAAAFSSSLIRCCSFLRSLCRTDIARIYVEGQH